MGCHQQAAVTQGGSISTDLMYFMQIEVPAAPINQETSQAMAAKGKQ
jgi:hypothetical protein